MTIRNRIIILVPYIFLSILLAGCEGGADREAVSAAANTTEIYVGATTCAGCHAEETELWQGSHHDLAMQLATPVTVLGDFSNSRFEHNGVSSRFFAEGDDLFVETDGSNGKLSVFPVRYAFGVYPLQQYLVVLPTKKIQALSVAWDSRSTEEGGQRWFHVYGDEAIDHTDVLHWTQPSQNWETMCADCHSTNLVSHYQLGEDRFETSWSELNVACEACHGPGKAHVDWAGKEQRDNANNGLTVQLTERQGAEWLQNAATGNSVRVPPRSSNTELDTCAGCHSRRAILADIRHPGAPMLDSYSPALIDIPLYHADGQILDEVYVYGSFLQSRMHQAGVSCSDCHDPHSLELRAPGPQVCLQCHAGDKFATVEHQLHADDDANCIDCHMPATTYMQVDPRNDHSFRIPRPQLSVEHGVPNACNVCHSDKNAEWATQVLRDQGRLPEVTQLHWTKLLAVAAGQGQASFESLMLLAQDPTVPAIIRASALSRLSLNDAPDSRAFITEFVQSPDPMLRWGAARTLQNSHPVLRANAGVALLDDPVRSVRVAAGSAMAEVDPVYLPAGSHAAVQRGLEEYISVQRVNMERAESHINIANVERAQGRLDAAEQSYLVALSVNPSFVPAYANLADLYRQWQREPDAERVLRAGIEVLPEQPALHHSLGLSLVRQQRLAEALLELKLATELPDAVARYALVYAIALNGDGQNQAAIQVLQTALLQFPDDPELANAWQEYSRQ
jgi:predicted CXXCH cytochrome family protein